MLRTRPGTLRQREIVLLAFPFSDQRERKRRPALVVSNDAYNQKADDCVVAAITSVLKDEPFSVTITNDDLEEGSLLKESRIRVDKLFTIEQTMIEGSVGLVNKEVFTNVKERLFTVF